MCTYAFNALIGIRKSIRPVKIEWWGGGVIICLEQGADCLHIVQLMPLHPKTPSSLASIKFRLVLPFWCLLTQFVLVKRPLLNGCGNSNSTCACGSVLLWCHCDILWTSSFTDGVRFACYVQETKKGIYYQQFAVVFDTAVNTESDRPVSRSTSGSGSNIYSCFLIFVLCDTPAYLRKISLIGSDVVRVGDRWNSWWKHVGWFYVEF